MPYRYDKYRCRFYKRGGGYAEIGFRTLGKLYAHCYEHNKRKPPTHVYGSLGGAEHWLPVIGDKRRWYVKRR